MSSFQSSNSSSDPVVVPTTENAIINQLSSVAAGLASKMEGWAQGVFAQTSQITNAAVGNFFQVSQSMLGMSNNLTNQYNNIFAPQNASLAAEADSYASPARMAVNMGQAGATQAQAGDAALKNSEEALRSYGIDPSSGRYAALDKAAAVQNAANVAGAQNTQRNADIATGQKLRSEAVQVGATLPAAIANINNTAIQANAGASNASLANANTGANLMRLPNEFLKTAMDVKLPPVGQSSRSSSSGSSTSPSRDGGGGGASRGGGGGPGGASPFGPSGPAWMPQHGAGQPGGGPQISTFNGGGGNYNDPTGANYDPMSGFDPSVFDGSNDYYNPEDGGYMGIGDAGANSDIFGGDFGTGGWNGSYGDLGGGDFGQTLPSDQFGGEDQTYNGMGGGTDTQYGNIGYDSGANNYDPGWDQTYDQPSPDTDWGSGADAFNDYGYAQGGPIYAQGGAIPTGMSPSGGQQVDDVQAQGPGGQSLHLNADEFVIPRDVALWKGQEFFQNLIDQSRKKRVTAPAKPSAGPPQPGKTNPPAVMR